MSMIQELWRIQMFGGLRASQGERVITRFRTQKTGALLAFLAYHRGHSHTRERLIEMLWPDSEPESGRHNLSLALSSLRSQLEPPGVPDGTMIIADRFSVELNPDLFTTDVMDFEEGVRRALQARNAPDRVDLLASAINAYGGELTPGYYEDWIALEQQRLAQRYAQTVSQLISLLEKEGERARALQYAQQAALHVPLHEEIQRELMRLLGESGELDAALRQYREYERLLEDELGETPTLPTRQLARSLQAQLERQPSVSAPSVVPAPRPAERAAPAPTATALPTGTVTFLFTDIEGSTAAWERAGDLYRTAHSLHDAVLRREFRRFGGIEVKKAGDSFLVAFASVSDGLSCAVACQRALAAQEWPELPATETLPSERLDLKVRMGLNTGDVELEEGDYAGLTLHRCARIMGAAHGGQIVCSEASTALLRRDLEQDIRLRDLGVYRLRGVEEPERLFQVDGPGMGPGEFPPLHAEPAHQAHLPLQMTRFFGREEEIARLVEMLGVSAEDPQSSDSPLDTPAAESRNARLVTLTGPGGTGKTRLAIEAAGRLAEAYHGAVWFIPLADLPESGLLMGAIVDALGIPRDPNSAPLPQAIAVLSRQRSLLILDNFEHLMEGGDRTMADAADPAEAVHSLLEKVPGLTLMITSRQVLGLPEEREFAVPPLATPGRRGDGKNPEQLSAYESVRLFVDRAQAVKPDFRITNQNAPAVAELCDRLEGIPLAIELAAARALVLTPGQMLSQLANRFEFLVSRRKGVSERQRTLRAAIDWSYRLLAPDLQRFFARLSVFRGGWTVEAAETVCEEPLALDFLAQIRESSLVLTEESPGGMRFRLLEMLREYAADRLGQISSEEPARIHQRHADTCLQIALEAEVHLVGAEQQEWLERLDREHDNLRAALAWCSRETQETTDLYSLGLRLGTALWRFWSIRGHARDGRRALERLLGQVPLPEEAEAQAERARALDALGALAHDMSDYAGAAGYLQESLALWRERKDRPHIAHTLNLLANVTLDQGRDSEAIPLYEEALALYREQGEQRGTAMVLSNLGALAVVSGQPKRAVALLEESLRLKRVLGNRYSLAIGLENLGNVERGLGNLDRAIPLHTEALAIRRELNHRAGIAMSNSNLGQALVLQGDSERLSDAATCLKEALEVFQELGDARGLAECLINCAALAGLKGQPSEGTRLAGAAAALRAENHIVLTTGDLEVEQALLAPLKTAVSDEQYPLLLAEGKRMSVEAAMELAATVLAPTA